MHNGFFCYNGVFSLKYRFSTFFTSNLGMKYFHMRAIDSCVVVNTSSRRRREGVQAHQYTQDTGTQ
jgi:hypothetical protein